MSEKTLRTVVFAVGILLTCIVKYSFDSYNDVFYPGKGLLYFFYLFLGSVLIAASAVFGNLFINRELEKAVPWRTKNNIFRFTLQGITALLYCILSTVAIVLAFHYLLHSQFKAMYLVVAVVMGTTIALLISSIYLAFTYFMHWEQALRESEELKHEALRAQFNALKSQVNPHILFNNLNSLATLITEDQEIAVEFVHRLANVLRYVLQSMDKRLVDLETELRCVDAYMFLFQVRFEDNIKLKISIPEKYYHYAIAPLTLQMLLENAVKHNIISNEYPLKVVMEINSAGDALIVRNTIRKKNVHDDATHVGLKNIQSRYKYLDKRGITIDENESEFTVTIPLLQDGEV
jgi:two-component system, LytTR family, sensor kinase